MLSTHRITKWVNSGGGRVFLLRDINMSIARSEFVSIMGPSGSGKSTLLNVLGMLDEFDEGNHAGIHHVEQRRRHDHPASDPLRKKMQLTETGSLNY